MINNLNLNVTTTVPYLFLIPLHVPVFYWSKKLKLIGIAYYFLVSVPISKERNRLREDALPRVIHLKRI